jgi:glycerol-3-phosphate cytidylyltransferase-like family protein
MKNDVIRKINPDVVTIRGDVAYDANEQVIEIEQAAYDAEVARLEAEHNATQYQRDRKAEYPSIEECVHAILDGELDALQALRAEIKARYPKP